MKNIIIGLKGRKFSGKTTVANFIINKYGFKDYAFGDPIKEALMHIFDFSKEQLWGSQEQKETVDPRWGISPRRAMEIFATDLLQFDIQKHLNAGELPFGRKLWVRRFQLWYERQIKEIPDMNLVITDIRFLHEAEALRKLDGVIWEIQRPDNPYQSKHLSETEQDGIIPDITIINNSSILNLETKIENELNIIDKLSNKKIYA